ncbi:hypothetical protein AXX17_AT3G49640 [Arabidopsis thaliana]|uniref:Uncharacterized protein n=1 Tax=Arabidopsis thaliana TaxID=3702 RepID=A0A178VBB0_ARATH|nr:hypothetical protein AXX17_AT3G49640 [Arabidopsis thaliana]
MLKVPFNAQITPDELPSDIRVLLSNEVGNIGMLAAVLIREKKMGQKSRWVPYISRLPQPAEMHSSVRFHSSYYVICSSLEFLFWPLL